MLISCFLQVQYYERLSPLVPLKIPLGSFANIKTGDCIVTFSRREIYRIKVRKIDHWDIITYIVQCPVPANTQLSKKEKINK